jgi:hypothetical protein
MTDQELRAISQPFARCESGFTPVTPMLCPCLNSLYRPIYYELNITKAAAENKQTD